MTQSPRLSLGRHNILAHRGRWFAPGEKNSHAALTQALLRGYGLETDVRDLDGELVISHDPPTSGDGAIITLETLLDFYVANGCRGILGLNVKADGLAPGIAAMTDARGISERCFVFDMSVPDTLGYFATPLPVYSRISEYEPAAAFADRHAGVWLDNFTGGFPQVERAVELITKGCTVAVVSPELHKRGHKEFWQNLAETLPAGPGVFQLCTDFPDEAAEFFDVGVT